jgi:predicted nucleic acid-binding protein
MYLLDTDILSLLLRGHPRVTGRVAQATEEGAITLIARIEVHQGRFDLLLKAEDGEKLLQAQQRLRESEDDQNRFTVVSIGPTPARSSTDFGRTGG